MKTITALALGLLVAGCVSRTPSRLECAPGIQDQSQADPRLFADLAWGKGSVEFMERTMFPGLTRRMVTKIVRLVSSDGNSQGVEEWEVAHGGGAPATYVVTIMPDRNGGSHYFIALKNPVRRPEDAAPAGPHGGS